MWFLKKKPDDGKWEEMNKTTISLMKEKKLKEALACAVALFEYSRKHYGKQDKKTVIALNNLGFIYTQKEDFDEAESYLLMALHISEKAYGKFSGEAAVVNINLAKLYLARAKKIREMEKTYSEMEKAGMFSENPLTEGRRVVGQ